LSQIVPSTGTVEGMSEWLKEQAKHAISEYDKNWELIQIGSPTDDNIPLMFRKKAGS